MDRKLLASEIAEYLRVSVEHVYDLVRDGIIPAQRLRPGGKLLFDLRAVEAALIATQGKGADTANAPGQEAAVGAAT